MGRGQAVKRNITIEQGTDWSCGPFQWRDSDGFPFDLSGLSGDEMCMQIREAPADDETTGSPAVLAAPVIELTLGNGRITLEPDIVPAHALDVAFQADNVVRFDPAIVGSPDFSTDASGKLATPVRANDTVRLSGTTSNDGDYLLVSVQPGEITVKNTDGTPVTFTAEAAAGTVEVENLGRFLLSIAEADNTFDLGDDHKGQYDLEISGSFPTTRLMEGSVTVKPETTRK